AVGHLPPGPRRAALIAQRRVLGRRHRAAAAAASRAARGCAAGCASRTRTAAAGTEAAAARSAPGPRCPARRPSSPGCATRRAAGPRRTARGTAASRRAAAALPHAPEVRQIRERGPVLGRGFLVDRPLRRGGYRNEHSGAGGSDDGERSPHGVCPWLFLLKDDVGA